MSLKLPALDPGTVPVKTGSGYPKVFHHLFQGRSKRRLGEVFGLTNFGVNLVTLPPGCMSSLRHWHTAQDEFIYVVAGEVTLITDEGEQVLKPGMCAGFAKGVANGHHFINKSSQPVTFLEVGDVTIPDDCAYPDVDLFFQEKADGSLVISHKDGTPY